MRKYKGTVSTNRIGSTVTFEFEVEDNATAEQIDEIAHECIWECISMDYKEIKNKS